MAIAYTCNLDWFTATMNADTMMWAGKEDVISRAGGKVVLQKANIYNKHYQKGYHVSVNGREFGNVLVQPREGNALQPSFVQFTAVNKALYEVGFMAEFEMACEVLRWKWRNPTRIDVALDGHGFHQIIKDVLADKVRQRSQATYGLYFRSQNRLQGYTWGKGDSDKYMRCYDKTEELKTSNKHYIKEFWDRAGLDQTENVQRLEVVLRNNELKKYPEFNPSNLDNFEYLATLMRSAFKKWFEFVDPSTDSNVSRMEEVEYIDWDSIGGGLLDKATAIAPSEYFRMKQMTKTCHFIYRSTGTLLFQELASQCAACIDHLDWYEKNQTKWDYEYGRLSGQNPDGLVHFEILSDLQVQVMFDTIQLIRNPKNGYLSGNNKTENYEYTEIPAPHHGQD